MPRRCLALAFLLPAFGASTATVDQLVAIIRSSLQHHDSDNRLAGNLRKIQLTERLDRRVAEELESEGAGPKAVAEMEMLADQSSALPAPSRPPTFRTPDEPSAEEKSRILQDAGTQALNYASSLPDFICTETVRRSEDLRGRPTIEWRLRDTLALRLSYFSHVEDYKLVAVNGHQTFRTYEEMGGAVSQGEFGSLLISIFKHAGSTRFRWDHWTNLRRRPTHVYSFRIPIEESVYEVHYATEWHSDASTHVAQRGFIYVDPESKRVVRVYAEAYDIPSDFPVTNIYTLLDYDFVPVGGTPYLLPIRALVRMGTARIQTRNEVEFAGYRKFASDTSITFDLEGAAKNPPPAKK